MMTSETASGLAGNSVQHAFNGAILKNRAGVRGTLRAFRRAYGEKERKTKAPQIAATAKCACCMGEFKRRWSWQKCCSRDCQLIYLAFQKFSKAYREGSADGLKETIRELAQVNR